MENCIVLPTWLWLGLGAVAGIALLGLLVGPLYRVIKVFKPTPKPTEKPLPPYDIEAAKKELGDGVDLTCRAMHGGAHLLLILGLLLCGGCQWMSDSFFGGQLPGTRSLGMPVAITAASYTADYVIPAWRPESDAQQAARHAADAASRKAVEDIIAAPLPDTPMSVEDAEWLEEYIRTQPPVPGSVPVRLFRNPPPKPEPTSAPQPDHPPTTQAAPAILLPSGKWFAGAVLVGDGIGWKLQGK